MKKRILIFISFIACIFLLTGCEQKENQSTKKMVCEHETTQDNLEIKLHYEVTYAGEYVKKVKTKEVMKSNSSATLEGYKEAIEKVYKNFDGIKYYNYEVKIEDDTLISSVSIDYEKVDVNRLLSVDQSVNQLIKNGKVKLEDIKEVYESVGATCKTE